MEKVEEDSIGPAETDDVVFVSDGDGDVGGAVDDVVFFADGSGAAVLVGNERKPGFRDCVCLLMESVAAESIDNHHLQRSPSVRRIPLKARDSCAGLDSAGLCEQIEMRDEGFGLCLFGNSESQGIKGRGVRIVAKVLRAKSVAALVGELIVAIESSIPQSPVDRVPAMIGGFFPAFALRSFSEDISDFKKIHLHSVEK